MPTLRRILKYTPAGVMGLLVMAWVVNAFANGWLAFETTTTTYFTGGTEGSLLAGFRQPLSRPGFEYRWRSTWHPRLGRFWLITEPKSSMAKRFPHNDISRVPTAYLQIRVPIAFTITAILPLAIGPFLSFRFQIWHYFAYTALVAVELAYYLRWQA